MSPQKEALEETMEAQDAADPHTSLPRLLKSVSLDVCHAIVFLQKEALEQMMEAEDPADLSSINISNVCQLAVHAAPRRRRPWRR